MQKYYWVTKILKISLLVLIFVVTNAAGIDHSKEIVT